jgi:hypothetical protein
MRGPPLAPVTATSLPVRLLTATIGDIALSGRLPGAMKFAANGGVNFSGGGG